VSGECDNCGEHTLECRCRERKKGSVKWSIMKWISVEDRHAPPMRTVLLYINDKVLPGWNESTQPEEEPSYCTWEGEVFGAEGVTHWMPLPKPPERKENEWELYEEPQRALSFLEIVQGLKEGKRFVRENWIAPEAWVEADAQGNIHFHDKRKLPFTWTIADIESRDWVEVKE
jgi:hypothetical protein